MEMGVSGVLGTGIMDGYPTEANAAAHGRVRVAGLSSPTHGARRYVVTLVRRPSELACARVDDRVPSKRLSETRGLAFRSHPDLDARADCTRIALDGSQRRGRSHAPFQTAHGTLRRPHSR